MRSGRAGKAARLSPDRRILLALVLAVAVPPLLGRAGIMNEYRALLIGAGFAYAAAGLSLNLLMGYAGQISLGQFAFLGVGAFTSGIITGSSRLALPFAVGIPAAAAAGAAVALLVGLPALRLRGLYLAVATMALNFAMGESLFRANYISRGAAGVELPRPSFGATTLTHNYDYLAVLAVLLVGLWWFDTNVTRTKLGRAFHAIRTDETVAASFGVDVARYKLLAFVLSGAFAGIAGVMFGHLFQFVNSESFDYQRSLLVVIIVVVGGLGSRAGVLASALFYAIFPILLIDAFGDGFRGFDLIVGAVLLMFTMSRHPTGLAGAMREARDRRRSGGSRRHIRRLEPPEASEEEIPKLPDLPRPTGLPARVVAVEGPLLSASGISVRFGGLAALQDVSLDVARGRIVGLIGPNGAGKTTLFNAIAGALRPQAGRVQFLGRDVSDAPAHVRARLGLGRTFQLIGLAKDQTLRENLLLAQHVVAGYDVGSALLHLPRASRVERELRTRADEAIAALGFERYADTPVQQLSHGQQRIVELGCLLVTAPELVMLDEPSAGMAPGAAENLAVRLRDIRDDLGRTVLLIEHNIPLVLDVCDELYVLSSGTMLAHGDPEDVVRRDDVITAYLGETVLV